MPRAILGAVAVGTLVWLLAGGMLNPTAAVNEGMLRMAGGLWGLAGAVIGGAADVVAAIRQNRSPGPGRPAALTPSHVN